MSYTEDLGRQIRAQVAPQVLPINRFRVRAARTAGELERAFGLLHEAYVGKDLQDAADESLRITAQHLLSESVVFVAWDDDQAVGTVTVTLDSPAGLPLDRDYPDQLRALRGADSRLAEVGSLAIRAPWRGSDLHLLLSMVSVWATRRIFGATHMVIGVNPAHANLYRAVFDFAPIGPARPHAELKGPVVGLACRLASLPAFLRQNFDQPLPNGRSVAEEFCGPLPPHSVEVPGALLRRDPAQWNIPRGAFQQIFIRRSGRLYSIDPATRRYLETQRTVQTLAHRSFVEERAVPQAKV